MPEEASIVTSNNLKSFFKRNLVFLRGTNGGTEKVLLSGSFPDLKLIHAVSLHAALILCNAICVLSFYLWKRHNSNAGNVTSVRMCNL